MKYLHRICCQLKFELQQTKGCVHVYVHVFSVLLFEIGKLQSGTDAALKQLHQLEHVLGKERKTLNQLKVCVCIVQSVCFFDSTYFSVFTAKNERIRRLFKRRTAQSSAM